MAQTKILRSLLLAQLEELLAADKYLLKAWPKLARLSTAKPLKTLCNEGVTYTEERIRRIEQACELLGTEPRDNRHQSCELLLFRR